MLACDGLVRGGFLHHIVHIYILIGHEINATGPIAGLLQLLVKSVGHLLFGDVHFFVSRTVLGELRVHGRDLVHKRLRLRGLCWSGGAEHAKAWKRCRGARRGANAVHKLLLLANLGDHARGNNSRGHAKRAHIFTIGLISAVEA